MVQHIRWTALWGRDFKQIGTEFEMIQREKSWAQTGQIIDAIEEFSLSECRQIASQLFRSCRKNGSS